MKTLLNLILSIFILGAFTGCVNKGDQSANQDSKPAVEDSKIEDSNTENNEIAPSTESVVPEEKSSQALDNDKGLAFAKCLKEKGAKFYGTNWCSHCQKQKELLGGEGPVKELGFVDCDANKEECSNAKVQAYPTWSINGKTLLGTQSLETLSQETGCAL